MVIWAHLKESLKRILLSHVVLQILLMSITVGTDFSSKAKIKKDISISLNDPKNHNRVTYLTGPVFD